MSVANDISGHELGDESPVSLARKGGLPPADKAHSSSLSDCEQGFSIEYLQARLVKSVKIVMLTTKLNLMLPCDPAAIVVNYLTAYHEESADSDVAEISKWEAIIWLAVIAGWISVLSEYLVKTIEGASLALKIPIAFISVVLLPVVGNAAEHASAITFAMKDKLDISDGVAIGSSTQIGMFGAPTSHYHGDLQRIWGSDLGYEVSGTFKVLNRPRRIHGLRSKGLKMKRIHEAFNFV